MLHQPFRVVLPTTCSCDPMHACHAQIAICRPLWVLPSHGWGAAGTTWLQQQQQQARAVDLQKLHANQQQHQQQLQGSQLASTLSFLRR